MTRNAETKYVKLTGIAGRETEKAIQFSWLDTEGDEQSRWFPLSQTKSILRSGDSEDEIQVAQWILDNDGIPY